MQWQETQIVNNNHHNYSGWKKISRSEVFLDWKLDSWIRTLWAIETRVRKSLSGHELHKVSFPPRVLLWVWTVFLWVASVSSDLGVTMQLHCLLCFRRNVCSVKKPRAHISWCDGSFEGAMVRWFVSECNGSSEGKWFVWGHFPMPGNTISTGADSRRQAGFAIYSPDKTFALYRYFSF